MSVSTGITPHTEPTTRGVQMGWMWVQKSHLTQNQLQEVYRWDECEYRNHTSHRINYKRCTDGMSVSTGITPHTEPTTRGVQMGWVWVQEAHLTEPTTGGVQIGWVWVQESHHTQNQLQEVYRWDECEYKNYASQPSGESRICQRGFTYYLAKCSAKTAKKWKNLDPPLQPFVLVVSWIGTSLTDTHTQTSDPVILNDSTR